MTDEVWVALATFVVSLFLALIVAFFKSEKKHISREDRIARAERAAMNTELKKLTRYLKRLRAEVHAGRREIGESLDEIAVKLLHHDHRLDRLETEAGSLTVEI